MKTKLFASLLCSLLSVSYCNVAYSAEDVGLTDVSPNHWAYKALEKLITKYNFKIGYPDNTFRGNKNITRYEVASLLAQVLEKSNSKDMSEDDLKIIKGMVDKYNDDLEAYKERIHNKIESVEDQIDILESVADKQAEIFGNFMDSFPFIIKGDVGFRYQLNTQKLGQDFTNQVPQARFSLGLESREDQPIGYGIKIMSGGINKITNKWWKFADFNAGLPIDLDRLFISYKPANFFEFTVGKFRDPFANTEIYMDEEISPQGLLQTFKFNDLSDVFKQLTFTAGEYVVNMDKDFGNTFSLNGSAELKMNFTDFVGVDLKGGYYHYLGENNIAKANIAPVTATGAPVAAPSAFVPRIIGNTNANTIDASGNYKPTFSIFNGFARVVFRLSDRFPLSFSGDYLYNVGTTQDNQAFQLGAKIGNTREPGNFFLGYNYKFLQADSTISLFVEDQLGSTDVQAHEGVFGIKIFPETVLSATLQAKNGIKKPALNNTYTLRINLVQSF